MKPWHYQGDLQMYCQVGHLLNVNCHMFFSSSLRSSVGVENFVCKILIMDY